MNYMGNGLYVFMEKLLTIILILFVKKKRNYNITASGHPLEIVGFMTRNYINQDYH